MERIEFLRQKALTHGHDNMEFHYRFYKRYVEISSDFVSEEKKYADAFYEAFSNLTPHITEGELIVGETVNGLSDSEKEEWENTYKKIAVDLYKEIGNGQDSHMAIDYGKVLSCGIHGVLADIDAYLATCDDEKREFYLSCQKCLEAIIVHSSRYGELAESLACQESREKRKAELMEIARICRKVPAYPAESFYEAVQAVHFITYCMSLNPFRLYHQQFQLGHPDRYLLPFYEHDIQSQNITQERAQLLLDCLGIQINMRVPNGLSSGYMVGGRDENGALVANILTDMCMQVIDDIKLVYPAVGLCYTAEMPDQYLEKACAILSHGRSHPAIFNDDVITKGLCG